MQQEWVKKRNKSFSFVQNFIYNLLFDKVGICGLLQFVVIIGRRAHVLHCIVKGDILGQISTKLLVDHQ